MVDRLWDKIVDDQVLAKRDDANVVWWITV